MKDTIEIDGIRYKRIEEIEDNSSKLEVIYSYEASSSIFDFTVLLNDNMELSDGTQSVNVYLNGRRKKSQCWDNVDWLKRVSRGESVEFLEDLNEKQKKEFINMLKDVHKKGWL